MLESIHAKIESEFEFIKSQIAATEQQQEMLRHEYARYSNQLTHNEEQLAHTNKVIFASSQRTDHVTYIFILDI